MKKIVLLLLLFVALCCASAYGEKRILVVGPESLKLIQTYTSEDVNLNSKQYQCVIKGEEVKMMSPPGYTDQAELEETTKMIEREQINIVLFLWPSVTGRPSPFSPYYPLSFTLLPHVRLNPQAFYLAVPGNEGEDNSHLGYDDLTRSLGMWQNPVFIGHKWENIQEFEHLACLNPLPSADNMKRGGCVASINVVETREGLKLIKDLQVGDAVLTPRGFSPVIYIEDHPNTTYPCVHYGGAWVTPDHFVYPLYENEQVYKAEEVVNVTMTVDMEVRTVVVQGDSYFCNRVLVSSYNRFSWLPKLSFLIDWLPVRLISLLRGVGSIFM